MFYFVKLLGEILKTMFECECNLKSGITELVLVALGYVFTWATFQLLVAHTWAFYKLLLLPRWNMGHI